MYASPQPQLPPTLSHGEGTVNQTSSYQEGEEAVGPRAAEEVAPIREQHGYWQTLAEEVY